jgi:processive 1,2-diacylglycerol beta-glucosyltransferase
MSAFYSAAYVYMITSSRRLWRLTYNLVNAPKGPYRPARAITQKWQFKRLKRFIQQSEFTHVISTHFTPSALLTDWRQQRELRCEIFSIVTDHEAHRCWKRTGMNHYFVASPRVASELQTIGVPEKDITISGIPVAKAFGSQLTREESRRIWNVPDLARVVLILCSAVTTQKSLQMLREFATVGGDEIRFLVIAGSDAQKEKQLREAFSADPRFTILGFTKEIYQLMKAADLIVTKPGGLIVSEAFATGLPQILLEPIPGQEEANADYAVSEGAALCCITHRKGVYREALQQIFSEPLKLAQMAEAARRVAKPHSAAKVVETILSRIVVSSSR